MAFIAVCPFCSLKLRGVPDRRAGDSYECPRCHCSFTLAAMLCPPKELLQPEIPMGHKYVGPIPSMNVAPAATIPAPTSREISECVQEVLEALPPDPHSQQCRPTGLDQTPATPVLRQRKVARRSWVPVVQASVALVFLFTGLGSTLWFGLGLSRWLRFSGPDQASKTMVAIAKDGAGRRPVHADSGWADAGREVLQVGDLRIRVVSASMRPAPEKQVRGDGSAPLTQLSVKFRLSNVGAGRSIPLSGWIEGRATLLDDKGVGHPAVTFPVEQRPIRPGKFVEETLVFEAPRRPGEFVRMEIPVKIVGLTEKLRLQLPQTMIANQGNVQ
jgi:hypothetical protein